MARVITKTLRQDTSSTAVAVEIDGNGAAVEYRAPEWSCMAAAAEAVGDSAAAMVGIHDGPAAAATESGKDDGSAQL